jgi:AraC-like DNA-binding protein
MLKGEIEQGFDQRRSVEYYARRLGYSEKTLTRACLRAEGRTAKDMIDQRVVLEAKRLLAYGDSAITEVGSHLGFSEVTNFLKFFKRITGISPAAFRSSLRDRSHPIHSRVE